MNYTLFDKVRALDSIRAHDGDIRQVGEQLAIPIATLKKWQARETELRALHETWQLLELHYRLTQKALHLLETMNTNIIEAANLNSLIAYMERNPSVQVHTSTTRYETDGDATQEILYFDD